MGVCAIFYRLSEKNLVALQQQPLLVYALLDMPVPKHRPAKGFLGRLLGLSVPVPPSEPASLPEPRDANDVGDVDKAWQPIHYLLTGSTEEETDHPLGFLCSGGMAVTEDLSFGPARVFTHAQVAVMVSELTLLNRDILYQRFIKRKWTGNRDEVKRDDYFDYTWHHFERMRNFFEEANLKKQGLLIYLC